MTAAERARLEEHRRLRRIIANPAVSGFERETAQASLDRLEERARPSPCPHCLDSIESHAGAVCRVLARFQRGTGKGLFPTASQSAELRARMAQEDLDRERAARAKDIKSRQRVLF